MRLMVEDVMKLYPLSPYQVTRLLKRLVQNQDHKRHEKGNGSWHE